MKQFWKSWASKMNKNNDVEICVNGSNEPFEIANALAEQFKSVYYDSNDFGDAKLEYTDCINTAESNQTLKNCCDSESALSLINVEIVDKCIRKLHLGKSCGPDGLMTEHLVHAHPLIVVYLSNLFKAIAVHGYTPSAFGSGRPIIIPIIKDRQENINDLNNYRGITLVPLISKLFELVILNICDNYVVTDDLQFGFKKNVGCSNALFSCRKLLSTLRTMEVVFLEQR